MLTKLFPFFYTEKNIHFLRHFIIIKLQKIVWLLSVYDSAIFEEEKIIPVAVRLLKNEEIKFSADRFVVNK